MIPSTDMFGNAYPSTGEDNVRSLVERTASQLAGAVSTRRRIVNNGDGDITANEGFGEGSEDWNWWLTGPYMMRLEWLQAMIDPRRDFDRECGYPHVIIPKQYRYMYDREGVSARVVDIYPDECWAVDPLVYENEEPTKTDFELAWEELCESSNVDPLHYFHRIDRISGIGRYGVLLLGVDDNADLSEPLEGIDENGFPTKKRPKNRKLLYMRAFDEMMAHIINYNRDPSSPRFGQPVFYHILFADVRVGEPGMTAASISVTSRVVHWSRIVHVADNRQNSEVFGVPRMQSVFNRLCDVRKILGGSAEMFWKGGFPGYSFELMPELVTAGVKIDQKSLEKQFDQYSNGLKRYLATVGLNAKSLAPQVADPEHSLDSQLKAIAMSIGAPLRIFMGSEQAQLASGQDIRTWNRRLTRRMGKYLQPKLMRPTIDRLICLGIMPDLKMGRNMDSFKYKIRWPDINLPNETEQSQIADRLTAALLKYITGGAYQVIHPYLFLTKILKVPEADAKVMAQAIVGKLKDLPDWPKITPPAVEAQAVKGEVAAEMKGGGGEQ